MIRTLVVAAATAILTSFPAIAQDAPAEGIRIEDAYARSMGGMGASGAVFMTIHNDGDADNRVVSATADVAERVELHTHKEDANGVMQMMEVKEGFPVPAGSTHALARGGDHVMLLGLTRELAQGDSFPLTIGFEDGTSLTIDVPVDNARMPAPDQMGQGMMHGKHGQGMMNGATD